MVAKNLEALKAIFPAAFTEGGTTKDTKSTKIDWDVLRELLGGAMAQVAGGAESDRLQLVAWMDVSGLEKPGSFVSKITSE